MATEKILFLDIDGTILLPDHTIQLSTIEAIKQVTKRGIKVFWRQADRYMKSII